MIRSEERKPDFNNLRLVLEKKPSPRPVLFEFIMGEDKVKKILGDEYSNSNDLEHMISIVKAFDYAGFDFAPILVKGLLFPRQDGEEFMKQTRSLNSGATIVDRESYEKYVWPENTACDFSVIKEVGKALGEKSKLIAYSYDGIMENIVGIVGYENLCFMLYDDLELVEKIFDQIGSRIHDFYKTVLEYEEVGAIICNDDWGFNSQTMISPEDLRKYVFPWYKKIVQLAHDKNKYAILHSCGYFEDIIDDIIYDMKFDARHSYEDNIMPVEKALDRYQGKIAILGGIDIDFLTRKGPDQIKQRALALLNRTKAKGGYALGSGNSLPNSIPDDNFLALLETGLEGYPND